jgi:ABC-type hemin transport system ATPase subunit
MSGKVTDFAFDKVSKGFNGRQVLSEVPFEVAPGEALCVMGRNGMGKSVTDPRKSGWNVQTEAADRKETGRVGS